MPPFVVDAIPEGLAESDGVVAVRNTSVRLTTVVIDGKSALHDRLHPQTETVILRVALETATIDNESTFDDELLEIRRKLKLALGDVRIDGTITQPPAQNWWRTTSTKTTPSTTPNPSMATRLRREWLWLACVSTTVETGYETAIEM